MKDDVVERSKAEAFLRNHAENCRIEGCHLTAERMDECADLLAQYRATILSLREQLESGGWVVGNGSRTKWRTWERGYSEWTDDLSKATRYYSRDDAEAVHAEDEDAWCIVAFSTLQQIKDTPA